MKLGSLRDWRALTRAEHAFIVIIAVVASEFVVAQRLALVQMLLTALGPALITLGAFAWNDYYGIKTDKALKRNDRPLVNGSVSPKAAFYGALVLIALGVTLTAWVNQTAFAIAGTFAVLSLLYDPVFKKLPLVGNAFIASSMSISFIYGNYVFSNTLNHNVALFSVIAFLMGLGRELILTLRDVEGDKKINAKTLPMFIGSKATIILSSFLLHLAVVLSLIPLFQKEWNWPYAIAIAATILLVLLGSWTAALGKNAVAFKKARNYTLYALLCGVVAFATLGL